MVLDASTNFVRELPPCSYCALAKAKRSSFRGPITIPDQIGGLFFADVQGPFEVPSLEGSVYKIGIIEAKTRYLWMTMADSKKVDGMLDQWLKDTIPWLRAQHGLKSFQFQTDNGEFSSQKCRDLVAAQGGTLVTYKCSLLSRDHVYYSAILAYNRRDGVCHADPQWTS